MPTPVRQFGLRSQQAGQKVFLVTFTDEMAAPNEGTTTVYVFAYTTREAAELADLVLALDDFTDFSAVKSIELVEGYAYTNHGAV